MHSLGQVNCDSGNGSAPYGAQNHIGVTNLLINNEVSEDYLPKFNVMVFLIKYTNI